jgi:hypothetical protein
VHAAFCKWQREDRTRDLNTLARILEAEFAGTPDPNSVSAVMSRIRKQGWERVPAAERCEHMRALARRPRPSRRKRDPALRATGGEVLS